MGRTLPGDTTTSPAAQQWVPASMYCSRRVFMLQWKTRFSVVIGNVALIAFALGFGGGLDPLHFGW